MIDIDPLLQPKAAAIFKDLVPDSAGKGSAAFTVADWERVQSTVGTPSALDDALFKTRLGSGSALPRDFCDALLSTLTLYAQAVEFFDTESQAREWWQTPLQLFPNAPARRPPGFE